MTVNKLPVTRTLQLTIDNNQGQAVANAYVGLLLADGLVDVTPAFTNYLDVTAEGTTGATGHLTLADLPVGIYNFGFAILDFGLEEMA